MIFILGGNGFVGSAFARLCRATGQEHVVLARDNYAAHRGRACSVLVNANGNSKKFLSNDEPLVDFDQSVRSVRASLVDFRYDTYVYLSSCDVYPDCSMREATRESQLLDVSRQSRYGFHKYLAEQCVRHVAKRHLVFRMGGFVGPGLKKNAIHDILNGGPLWLDPASELQFLHCDTLAQLVLRLVQTGVVNDTFNICGRDTVRLAEVIAWAGGGVPVRDGAPRVRYEIDLGKLSQHVELPETRPTVKAFVLQELQARQAA